MHGFTAHLNDERLGDRDKRSRAGHRETGPVEALHIEGKPRERHGWVHGKANSPLLGEWLKHSGTVPPGGVHKQLPGADHAPRGDALNNRLERIIRNSQKHKFASFNNLLSGQHGYARQQVLGALS